MARDPDNWLDRQLRELGVEREATAAKLAAFDLVERAREAKMQVVRQIGDLARRIEKLEQGIEDPQG
jgi:phage host-nuclease inhibitor protein Gam